MDLDALVLVTPLLETELAIAIDVAADEACEKLGLPLLGGPSGRGWSYHSTAQLCPHLWKETYGKHGEKDGRERTHPAPELQIGNLFHLLLALYYAYGLDGEGNALYRNRGLLAPSKRLGRRGPRSQRDRVAIPSDAADRLLAALKERADLHAAPASIVPEERPSLSVIFEAERIFDAHTNFYGDGREDLIPLAVEWHAADPRLGYTCRYDLIAQLGPNDPFVRSGELEEGAVLAVEHKCLPASARIFDYETGRFWRVDALVAAAYAPLVRALGERGRLVTTRASVPWPATVCDIAEVTLTSGRRLRVSDNHPVLTASGWTPAGKLTSTDWVALAATTGGFDGSQRLSDAEVRFVGYMLGDGACGGPSLSWSKTDERVVGDFVQTCTDLGIHVKPRRDGDMTYIKLPSGSATSGYRPQGGGVRSASTVARDLLEQLGLYGKRAAEKFIPDELLSLPDRQTAVLLGALWNTDGCVSVDVPNKSCPEQRRAQIRYSSRSEQLCRDIQTLLLRLGIPSTLSAQKIQYSGEQRPYLTTRVVTRVGKRRFLKAIPLLRQRASTEEVLSALPTKDDALIPLAWLGKAVSKAILAQKTATVTTAERWALLRDLPECSDLIDAEIHWDRVARIAIVGREQTFHLEVPRYGNFVVDDVITHNSARWLSEWARESWFLDGEVLGEALLWEPSGCADRFGPLAGILVNLTTKEKVPKFARILVPRKPAALATFERTIRWQQAEIELWRAAHYFPRRLTSCWRYGRPCGLLQKCRADAAAESLEILQGEEGEDG